MFVGRCALAVRREWRSVEHSVQFWKADHDDDPSLKLELVEEIAELHVRSCMKCLCPKEGSPFQALNMERVT